MRRKVSQVDRSKKLKYFRALLETGIPETVLH
jgi:hypothetical protein